MEGTEVRRFIVEVSVNTDSIPPDHDLRDDLLDAFCAVEDYPGWVFSIDNVEDAR